MKWTIWEERCLLLLQIKSLEKGSLAKIIYQEAEDNGWSGLGKEVWQICKIMEISDINIYNVTKKDIQRAIQKSHFNDMMNQFEIYKKLEDIKDDNL